MPATTTHAPPSDKSQTERTDLSFWSSSARSLTDEQIKQHVLLSSHAALRRDILTELVRRWAIGKAKLTP